MTAEKICYESDVVILGNAPLYFVKRRLKDKKIVFNYSERWFKSGFLNHPGDVIRAFTRFTLNKNKNFFQLCASAFAANDCKKVFAFPNRKFRWGYFPPVKKYNVELLLEKKEQFSIAWVGRLIRWKHPELVVDIAEKLAKEGYDFNLKIIGVGELESEISNSIISKGLSDKVKILGKMTPEDVRDNMEKSQLFLFTSDKGEGWGAVLNEAMNSACAVIASDAIGSAPYLIKDGKNGYLYQNGNFEQIYSKTKKLLLDKTLSDDFGKNAYETINSFWNADIAVQRLYDYSNALLENKELPVYEEGPMSIDNGKLK